MKLETRQLDEALERDRRDLTRMIIKWRAFKRWLRHPLRASKEQTAGGKQ